MVRQGFKGRVLGKEKKLAILADRKKKQQAIRSREDKRWKSIIERSKKADPTKAKKLHGVGNTGKFSRVRGATRASLREPKERKPDNVTYECTIHLSKLLQNRTFNKRAPLAIKKIRNFASKMMKTKDNRIDASLNTYIWHRGVKGVPGRVRVRIQRKVAENPEGSSKRKNFYTVISNVAVASFKGLKTKTIQEQ